MPVSAILVSMVTSALAALVLAGLLVRRKADACISFSAYLVSAGLGHGLLAAFPGALWNWEYEFATELIQTLLVVLVPFEMAFKTYRALPAGFQRLRRIMLAITVIIAVAVIMFSGHSPASAYDWIPVCSRISYGAMFLLLAYVFFSQYHQVPIDPVFRDVTVGFTYLTVIAAFTSVLARLDPVIGWGRDTLVAVSYPLLLVWWARCMWAPEEPTGLSRESMQFLQPWRVKRVRWTR